MSMKFTFDSYLYLLDRLRSCGYVLTNFSGSDQVNGSHVIVRHDIDLSPRIAERFSLKEMQVECYSTYFVMISSSFYNLLDKENEEAIRKIQSYGHEIGLHFDASKYDGHKIIPNIKREVHILESILECPVKSISWHIPVESLVGKRIWELNELGIKNAYDLKYVNGYKYLSDSMMRWREEPEDFMDTSKYPRLQILTHPVWYSEYGKREDVAILDSVLTEKLNKDLAYLEAIRPGFR